MKNLFTLLLALAISGSAFANATTAPADDKTTAEKKTKIESTTTTTDGQVDTTETKTEEKTEEKN